MILILDFGSQTTHLIARRIRDLGFQTEILPGDTDLAKINQQSLKGIILSGGPASVYSEKTTLPDKRIFDIGVPVLGICYGLQVIASLLGGEVKRGVRSEYGPAFLFFKKEHPLFKNTPQKQIVWLSHGDEVCTLPEGFIVLGSTEAIAHAIIGDDARKIYGVQFHPEVEHTEYGNQILKNFLNDICQIEISEGTIKISDLITKIKEQVKGAQVIAAVSGGVDSTVAAVLAAKAINENLIPIYIENGLMRSKTKEEVLSIFKNRLEIKPVIIEAKSLFLKKLKGITNPEQKRKIIGKLYIQLFQKEARRYKNAQFLLQGTIYSDVIESKGTKHADKIKSHHNVGGLPKKLKLKLLEPLREFYKDEVRLIGKNLGLPDQIVYKQPFPGPGNAIRIIGSINSKRLKKQQAVDQILMEEIIKAGWERKIFQSFPILTGVNSTAVKGDARFYGEVVALRIYESTDIMTANWARLPYELLQKISSRIVNEVPGISRVVYDITTKPPGTMEWE